ncbi:hypothetical protein LzC2_26440 [Planctomycetes bacterium LzC2]|uniref:Uncharacterized protein n=1 Tax=Alienimonas chondri TaxID=2681879 RepID=A0ABX1VG81_9PLAN|nr:hypothetical protein [Alienimonas chondri]
MITPSAVCVTLPAASSRTVPSPASICWFTPRAPVVQISTSAPVPAVPAVTPLTPKEKKSSESPGAPVGAPLPNAELVRPTPPPRFTPPTSTSVTDPPAVAAKSAASFVAESRSIRPPAAARRKNVATRPADCVTSSAARRVTKLKPPVPASTSAASVTSPAPAETPAPVASSRTSMLEDGDSPPMRSVTSIEPARRMILVSEVSPASTPPVNPASASAASVTEPTVRAPAPVRCKKPAVACAATVSTARSRSSDWPTLPPISASSSATMLASSSPATSLPIPAFPSAIAPPAISTTRRPTFSIRSTATAFVSTSRTSFAPALIAESVSTFTRRALSVVPSSPMPSWADSVSVGATIVSFVPVWLIDPRSPSVPSASVSAVTTTA